MKGAYERLYWFSPSCDVDHQMVHIKRFVEEELHTPITEKWCFAEWNPEEMWKIMDKQKDIVEDIKKKGLTYTIPGTAIVIND